MHMIAASSRQVRNIKSLLKIFVLFIITASVVSNRACCGSYSAAPRSAEDQFPLRHTLLVPPSRPAASSKSLRSMDLSWAAM